MFKMLTNGLSQDLNLNPLKVTFTEVQVLGTAQIYTFC